MKKMPQFDQASASVDARINQMKNVVEDIERKTVWKIKRYESKTDLKQGVVYESKEAKDCFDEQPQFSVIKGNVLLNEGITEALKLLATSGATQWATGAYLGTGTSTTGEQASDTGLIANPVYKAMDGTYPQVSSQTVTWQSTFASGDANQAWQEYSVSNTSSDSGKNLNRKTSSQGTKQSGQSWQLQLAITLS